jgi:hypothetical protein
VGSLGWVVERFQVDYNGNIERSSREGGSVVHVAFALPWPWLSTHYGCGWSQLGPVIHTYCEEPSTCMNNLFAPQVPRRRLSG